MYTFSTFNGQRLAPRNRREACLDSLIRGSGGTWDWQLYTEDVKGSYNLPDGMTANMPTLPLTMWGWDGGLLTQMSATSTNFYLPLHCADEPFNPTWDDIWTAVDHYHEHFESMPIAIYYTQAYEGSTWDIPRWTLHRGLQPLADTYVHDIANLIAQREAGNDPSLIPGMGEYPTELTEELFRHLTSQFKAETWMAPKNKEVRYPFQDRFNKPEWKLALAQWRRYRLMQYGFTPESWKSGKWSIFQVPLGEDTRSKALNQPQ